MSDKHILNLTYIVNMNKKPVLTDGHSYIAEVCCGQMYFES